MWGGHSCPPKADSSGKLEVMPKRKAANKKKPAMDVLISSFMRLREEARQRMIPEEFEEAEREFHKLADNVRKRAGARPKSPATRPK
jgi:hypothetical protein